MDKNSRFKLSNWLLSMSCWINPLAIHCAHTVDMTVFPVKVVLLFLLCVITKAAAVP